MHALPLLGTHHHIMATGSKYILYLERQHPNPPRCHPWAGVLAVLLRGHWSVLSDRQLLSDVAYYAQVLHHKRSKTLSPRLPWWKTRHFVNLEIVVLAKVLWTGKVNKPILEIQMNPNRDKPLPHPGEKWSNAISLPPVGWLGSSRDAIIDRIQCRRMMLTG